MGHGEELAGRRSPGVEGERERAVRSPSARERERERERGVVAKRVRERCRHGVKRGGASPEGYPHLRQAI